MSEDGLLVLKCAAVRGGLVTLDSSSFKWGAESAVRPTILRLDLKYFNFSELISVDTRVD